MRVAQRISVIGLLAVAVLALQAKADYRDDSRALRVSGGEDHTLVLTADSGIWACGPNGGYDYEAYESYFGVLGTGSYNPYLEQKTLVRVHGPNDVNYIDDITEVDAGWKHSLALDVNGFVWSWGFNSWGSTRHQQPRLQNHTGRGFAGRPAGRPLSAKRLSQARHRNLCGAERGTFLGCRCQQSCLCLGEEPGRPVRERRGQQFCERFCLILWMDMLQ